MSTFAHSGSAREVAEALDIIIAGLDKMVTGFAALRQNLTSDSKAQSEDFDPKDARNKYEVGGLEKLTPRGVEICYRLFDKRLTRYGVAQAMGISFGAATHRYDAWLKAGGFNRTKQSID